MRTIVVLASLLAISATLPLAFAEHGVDTFTATGHIVVGNPTSQFAGSLAELGVAEGIDGVTVALPAWAPGHPVWVNGSSANTYDLDVYFYDAAGGFVAGECNTESVDETCDVPVGAASAVVNLWVGADVDFVLTVVSETGAPPPPPPPEDVGYVIPMFGPFTWDHAELSVVIVPSTAGPLYDADLTPRPEGMGTGADASYVKASEDAMDAWEAAIDAYVADHPEASHLNAFELDVRVVGRDATMADADAADVRILFSPAVPLGVGVLGIAIATETDDEGRFIRCDIINADWLIFSYTAADMYNIHSQEFGHCLGLGHPEEPADDIMNGLYEYLPGEPSNPRMCHSSLDVRALEVAYAWMGGSGVWEPAPVEVTQAPGQYERYPAVGGGAECPML